LRPETEQLLKQSPGGRQLARLNKLLLEDAYPGELATSSLTGWVVKDGAMASTGEGLQPLPALSSFAVAQPGEKPLDALGGRCTTQVCLMSTKMSRLSWIRTTTI